MLKLILKSHSKDIAGFINNKLEIEFNNGDTLEIILSKLNEFRSPSSQINNLYSINGICMPKTIRLNKDVELYINKK